MKYVFCAPKIIFLIMTLFIQQQGFAPIRPLEHIPVKFLSHIDRMVFEWPLGHKKPELGVWPTRSYISCSGRWEKSSDGRVVWPDQRRILPKDGREDAAQYSQAYLGEDDDLERCGQVLCFHIKPQIVDEAGRIISSGEMILVPVSSIQKDRLDLSFVGSEPVVNIKLYNDKQMVFEEVMQNWVIIIAPLFIRFLMGESVIFPRKQWFSESEGLRWPFFADEFSKELLMAFVQFRV